VRHDLCVAEIAHESTSSLANGGDRGLLCRPVRQWRGWKKIDTFTIPKRAQAAGVSTLLESWTQTGHRVNQNQAAKLGRRTRV
jgi:hypothetical protein